MEQSEQVTDEMLASSHNLKYACLLSGGEDKVDLFREIYRLVSCLCPLVYFRSSYLLCVYSLPCFSYLGFPASNSFSCLSA